MPTADAFKWSADPDGNWLWIKCKDPQQIISTIKLGKQYDFSITEHRERRSLDANALYWKLLTAFAKVVGQSNAATHNRMLRSYGEVMEIGGRVVYVFLPDTDEAENEALEADTFHLRPTSQTKPGKGEVNFRAYTLLKGSSDMDAKEFSHLLDGLISECKQVGVETLSYYEQELIRQWDAQTHQD